MELHPNLKFTTLFSVSRYMGRAVIEPVNRASFRYCIAGSRSSSWVACLDWVVR